MKNLKEYLIEAKGTEKYYLLDYNELDDNKKLDDILSEIEPECVLGPNDYNKKDNSMNINGEEVSFWEDNINFYGRNAGKKYPQSGDLVFELSGEYAVYRPGLGLPSSFSEEYCSVGTREDIVNYLRKFKKDLEDDMGCDIEKLLNN